VAARSTPALAQERPRADTSRRGQGSPNPVHQGTPLARLLSSRRDAPCENAGKPSAPAVRRHRDLAAPPWGHAAPAGPASATIVPARNPSSAPSSTAVPTIRSIGVGPDVSSPSSRATTGRAWSPSSRATTVPRPRGSGPHLVLPHASGSLPPGQQPERSGSILHRHRRPPTGLSCAPGSMVLAWGSTWCDPLPRGRGTVLTRQGGDQARPVVARLDSDETPSSILLVLIVGAALRSGALSPAAAQLTRTVSSSPPAPSMAQRDDEPGSGPLNGRRPRRYLPGAPARSKATARRNDRPRRRCRGTRHRTSTERGEASSAHRCSSPCCNTGR
jgi:hypothetical protein